MKRINKKQRIFKTVLAAVLLAAVTAAAVFMILNKPEEKKDSIRVDKKIHEELVKNVENSGPQGTITPVDHTRKPCTGPHTLYYRNMGSKGHVVACSVCYEVIGEEEPHENYRERNDAGMVIGDKLYAVYILKCSACDGFTEYEYEPIDDFVAQLKGGNAE